MPDKTVVINGDLPQQLWKTQDRYGKPYTSSFAPGTEMDWLVEFPATVIWLPPEENQDGAN